VLRGGRINPILYEELTEFVFRASVSLPTCIIFSRRGASLLEGGGGEGEGESEVRARVRVGMRLRLRVRIREGHKSSLFIL
jgi:hypothetical protein